MKKTFLLFTVLLSISTFSQTESEKVMKLVDVIKNNMENKKVLDSVKIELEKFNNSSDIIVQSILPKTKYLINDLITLNNNYTETKGVSSLSEEDLKGFRISDDKFNNRTFIHYKKWGLGTVIEPYIGISKGGMFLRLKTNYQGFGWIFFDKVLFLINGNNYEYKVEDVDRDVLSGSSVQEIADNVTDENIINILYLISDVNNKVSVRLEGKYHKDYELRKSTQESIKKVLDLFEKLKK